MNEDKLSQIASRKDFHEAIREALAQAADVGASEICLVDPDFVDWPLNDRAIVETLARWAAYPVPIPSPLCLNTPLFHRALPPTPPLQ